MHIFFITLIIMNRHPQQATAGRLNPFTLMRSVYDYYFYTKSQLVNSSMCMIIIPPSDHNIILTQHLYI